MAKQITQSQKDCTPDEYGHSSLIEGTITSEDLTQFDDEHSVLEMVSSNIAVPARWID